MRACSSTIVPMSARSLSAAPATGSRSNALPSSTPLPSSSSMPADKIQHYGAALYEALRTRKTIAPLIEQDPSLTLDDAYAINLDFLSRRVADGEKVVGKKIGVTSKAVQDMLGVHQPDFGFLTDWMHVEGDIDIDAKALIAPRAEAEIAFILKSSLNGPGVTPADVLAPT